MFGSKYKLSDTTSYVFMYCVNRRNVDTMYIFCEENEELLMINITSLYFVHEDCRNSLLLIEGLLVQINYDCIAIVFVGKSICLCIFIE